jgi:hypothetical protein
MHKLLLGRDLIDGDSLASQPTLSRFENQVERAYPQMKAFLGLKRQ